MKPVRPFPITILLLSTMFPVPGALCAASPEEVVLARRYPTKMSWGEVEITEASSVEATVREERIGYPSDTARNSLFLNPGHGNHWITLILEGVRSNRAGDRDIYATAETGGSFGSSSLQQEIGLGHATSIRQVEVFWPASGTRVRVPLKNGHPHQNTGS